MQKIGHFRKQIRNNWKVFKCGTRERCRLSVEPPCEKNEVLQRVKEEKNIIQTKIKRKANSTGHILHRNCLLKHIIEGKMDERIEMAGR